MTAIAGPEMAIETTVAAAQSGSDIVRRAPRPREQGLEVRRRPSARGRRVARAAAAAKQDQQ